MQMEQKRSMQLHVVTLFCRVQIFHLWLAQVLLRRQNMNWP